MCQCAGRAFKRTIGTENNNHRAREQAREKEGGVNSKGISTKCRVADEGGPQHPQRGVLTVQGGISPVQSWQERG